MRKNVAAVMAAFVAVALAAAGCGSGGSGGSAGSAASGGKKSVKLAVLAPSSLLWLHAIAKDKGFYGKHNVDVTEIQVQSSSSLVQAVSSGSADAGLALGDNVLRAIDQGAKITIAGTVLNKAALRLYLAKGLTDVSQVKGGKVTAGAVEGGTSDLLLYQLEQAGVARGDVQLMGITNSKDRVTALENGQVKAALLIPPFDTLAEKAGAKLLGWYDQPYVETPLIVNTGWAGKNEAAAKGVTQALAEAAKWIYDPANKDASADILAKYTGTDKATALAAYAFMVTDGKVISSDLRVPDNGLNNIAQITAKVTGKTQTPLDQSKYWDPKYLQ
jgi:ABC-type nitrate/sulfonate/bicarbonate transport system substrate-binding protein